MLDESEVQEIELPDLDKGGQPSIQEEKDHFSDIGSVRTVKDEFY